MAIITKEDGTRIEALSLYLQRQDLVAGPFHPAETLIGLPLASGVIVHFEKMKSFEIRCTPKVPKQSALPSGAEAWDAEATITLQDGTTITEKLVDRAHVAELRGGHALGSFDVALGDIKRVDFQW